jgi:excinuclease ABC subunit A
MQVDRYKIHDIEIAIDTLRVTNSSAKRLNDGILLAMKHGKGSLMVINNATREVQHYSRHLMCPTSGISYNEPEPNTFSFNSPYGACKRCNGLGKISEIDINKIIPDRSRNIRKGGLAPLGSYKNNWIFKQIEAIGVKHGFSLETPIAEIPDEALNTILYGSDEVFRVKNEYLGVTTSYSLNFEGIVNFIMNQNSESTSKSLKRWVNSFMNRVKCPECGGSRLKNESLHFKISGKNIAELAQMDIINLYEWVKNLPVNLDERKLRIAGELIREILNRIQFLLDVGLDYLSRLPYTKPLGKKSFRWRIPKNQACNTNWIPACRSFVHT